MRRTRGESGRRRFEVVRVVAWAVFLVGVLAADLVVVCECGFAERAAGFADFGAGEAGCVFVEAVGVWEEEGVAD
jgi:hypothetical protein